MFRGLDPSVKDLCGGWGSMISPTCGLVVVLTEQGLATVFRVCGRDTFQGTMVGDDSAERWGDQDIAIVHDGSGHAGHCRRALAAPGQHGVTCILTDPTRPRGLLEFIDRLQAEGIDALYFAGYTAEAGLIRQGSGAQVRTIYR